MNSLKQRSWKDFQEIGKNDPNAPYSTTLTQYYRDPLYRNSIAMMLNSEELAEDNEMIGKPS